MKIPFGLTGKLALSLIAITLLSHYMSYRSFEDLITSAIQQRESDKIRTVSRIITPRIDHDVTWVESVSRMTQRELSAVLKIQGEARLPALRSLLDRIYLDSRVDILQVTDETGIVLYRAHDPSRNGDLAKAWGIEEALAGKGNGVSEKTDKGALIEYIEPIRDGERVIGTVISGVQIDEKFIKTLSTETGAELALIGVTGKVVASSNRTTMEPDPSAIAEAFQKKIAA